MGYPSQLAGHVVIKPELVYLNILFSKKAPCQDARGFFNFNLETHQLSM